MRIGFSIKYSFRKIFDAVISGGMVSVDDKRNTLDGKFFPLDIYQLPFINAPIRSKVGGGGGGKAGKGDCTYKVNRRPLRHCFSAGARAMYVYFFFLQPRVLVYT